MRTISQAVEEVILRSPLLVEVMAEGLANNAQIARKIKPAVEKRLLEKVSEQAISMALHRLGKHLRVPLYGQRFLKQLSDITVRSNLVELICPNSVDLPSLLEVLLLSTKRRKDTFVNFSRGLHESLLIIDRESEKEISQIVRKYKNIRRNENLSAITLHLPEASLDIPGVYYPILKALASEGISFVEVLSVRTEFSILFKDKDIDRAFSTLKRLASPSDLR